MHGTDPGLVIFDCGGVLVDSNPLYLRVDSILLRDLGCEISDEEIAAELLGLAPREWVQEVERRLGRTLPEGWARRYERMHHDVFASELRPVDGIEAALGAIVVPVCVASNDTGANVAWYLRLAGLSRHFGRAVFTAEDVERAKPAPDLFLHAARRLGVPAERCVVIEDGAAGIRAARAAGMRAFAFDDGRDRNRAWSSGATKVFTKMSDLPGLLAGG